MKALHETLKHWTYVERYVCIPRNQSDYHSQLELLEELISLPRPKRDLHTKKLIKLLTNNLEVYECRVNPSNKARAVDVLLFLMDQHELTQADLPEIGSQSLVSKIINGERKLTAEHIRKLSKRFHVSPAVFFE